MYGATRTGTMRATRWLPALALAIPCLGFTECPYFSPVVVPAVDTTAPTAYVGIWTSAGGYEALSPYGPVDRSIGPNEQVLAFAVASDAGGAQALRITADEYLVCCRGDICQVVNPGLPMTETQPGSTGATVSNGIWNGRWIARPTCPAGYTLQSYAYRWSAVATDFRGNTSPRSASGAIHYP